MDTKAANMALLSKLTYRFNTVPIKTQLIYCKIDKLILKFIHKCKRLRISSTILKNKVTGLMTKLQ